MNISWNVVTHFNAKNTRNIVKPIVNDVSFNRGLFMCYNVG